MQQILDTYTVCNNRNIFQCLQDKVETMYDYFHINLDFNRMAVILHGRIRFQNCGSCLRFEIGSDHQGKNRIQIRPAFKKVFFLSVPALKRVIFFVVRPLRKVLFFYGYGQKHIVLRFSICF